MQKTELAWEYQHQKGLLIYTFERGLEKVDEQEDNLFGKAAELAIRNGFASHKETQDLLDTI
jgi:hypothetical protein